MRLRRLSPTTVLFDEPSAYPTTECGGPVVDLAPEYLRAARGDKGDARTIGLAFEPCGDFDGDAEPDWLVVRGEMFYRSARRKAARYGSLFVYSSRTESPALTVDRETLSDLGLL